MKLHLFYLFQEFFLASLLFFIALSINPVNKTPKPSAFAISSILDDASPQFNGERAVTTKSTGALKNNVSFSGSFL